MLNFSDSTNWTLIHDADYTANIANNSNIYPFVIGEKIIPNISSCNHLFIKTSWNNPVNTNWVNAGVLRRRVNVNLPNEILFSTYLERSNKILLNNFTFVEYGDYNGDVSLCFTPYERIQQLSITIWKYTGVQITSNNQDLSSVLSAINTLQTSVNYLNELIGG